MVVGIIVAVVVVGGAGYFFTQRGSDPSESNASNAEQNSNEQSTVDVSTFDAVPTSGTSFSATITSKSADGKTTQAVMEYDKSTGNTSYSSQDDGKTFKMVYTKDAYYMCQDGDTCIKYPLNGVGDNSFDPSTYEYTDAEIEGFRNTAVDAGEQDCPSGKCYVWKVTENGYESSVFIDTKTKRIVQVEGTSEGTTSKIVYEYKDVSVVPPANAQEIPSFNGQ